MKFVTATSPHELVINCAKFEDDNEGWTPITSPISHNGELVVFYEYNDWSHVDAQIEGAAV